MGRVVPGLSKPVPEIRNRIEVVKRKTGETKAKKRRDPSSMMVIE